MQHSKQKSIINLYNDIVSFLSYPLCNHSYNSQKPISFAFMISLSLDCLKSQLSFMLSPNYLSRKKFLFSLLSGTFSRSLISTLNSIHLSRSFRHPLISIPTLQHSNILLYVSRSDEQVIEPQELTVLICSDFWHNTEKLLQSMPGCCNM